MRNNREYQICKDIAIYLRLQYPKVIFHFDLAGMNLSRAQAGMMKGIQGGRGWPDLFIAEPKDPFNGLFIEVKTDVFKAMKRDGTYVTTHIEEQVDMLQRLRGKMYKTTMGVGFDECKDVIDDYLK
jgi:hypothetical protein